MGEDISAIDILTLSVNYEKLSVSDERGLDQVGAPGHNASRLVVTL